VLAVVATALAYFVDTPMSNAAGALNEMANIVLKESKVCCAHRQTASFRKDAVLIVKPTRS